MALDYVLYGEETLATTTSAETTLLLPQMFSWRLSPVHTERVCVLAVSLCSDSPQLLTQKLLV